MLKRRLSAAIGALLAATLGGVLLRGYVMGADDRAMAGMATAEVLVATAFIPEGTSTEALGKLVALKTLPVKAITEGTLRGLDSVPGRISTVDLQPGEQLIGARFVDPATLKDPSEISIPPGMQLLSISIERPRMLGGVLTPGATVGVLMSLAKEGEQSAETHFILHKVLVTKVGEGGSTVPTEGDGPSAEPEASPPSDSVVVTFALTASEAEKIIFGAEHGRLWLSLEPNDATTSGTKIVTPGNVYR